MASALRDMSKTFFRFFICLVLIGTIAGCNRPGTSTRNDNAIGNISVLHRDIGCTAIMSASTSIGISLSEGNRLLVKYLRKLPGKPRVKKLINAMIDFWDNGNWNNSTRYTIGVFKTCYQGDLPGLRMPPMQEPDTTRINMCINRFVAGQYFVYKMLYRKDAGSALNEYRASHGRDQLPATESRMIVSRVYRIGSSKRAFTWLLWKLFNCKKKHQPIYANFSATRFIMMYNRHSGKRQSFGDIHSIEESSR